MKHGFAGRVRNLKARVLLPITVAIVLLMIPPLLSAVGIAPATAQEGASLGQLPITLELLTGGLDQPVHLTDAGDGRMFIVEKSGRILVMMDGNVAEAPLLDLADRISSGSEQGLLSMALHPEFADNGRFFVYYTDPEGHTRVVEYGATADGAGEVDPDSGRELLFVEQPYPNHNGGMLLFGPDGYLYIGLGDGGGQGDPFSNAQNPGVLLGKILRIDVDTTTGELPYGIPSDNPFVDREDARPEIWALGLRNPWRFSFDRATGDLYIGDVGQNAYEEISFAPAGSPGGLNFGWNPMEGFVCFLDGCDSAAYVEPVHVYSHRLGCSVTGGYVARSPSLTPIEGVYLFADYCTGYLWGITADDAVPWSVSEPFATEMRVASFAEDRSGELYVIDLGGAIYRIVTD